MAPQSRGGKKLLAQVPTHESKKYSHIGFLLMVGTSKCGRGVNDLSRFGALNQSNCKNEWGLVNRALVWNVSYLQRFFSTRLGSASKAWVQKRILGRWGFVHQQTATMSNFAVCSQRQILDNWSLGSAAPCFTSWTSSSSSSSSLPFLLNKSRKVYNKVSSSSLGGEESRHRASRLGLENWKLKSRVFGAREYGGGKRGRSWNGKGRWWLQVRAEVEPLDLTEDNVQHVLLDARSEVRRDSSNSFSSSTHPPTLGLIDSSVQVLFPFLPFEIWD